MNQQELFNWCDAHFDEQLQLLKALAAIPAPSHCEQKRAEFIRDWLVRQGARNVTIDPALNVVLPFGCEGRQDIRVYMAHTDVVFPDTDPLPVREENGRLYAPGVGDDTANVSALMLCAKYFLTHPGVLKTPVLMVFNSCEEGFGNLKGVRQIMADYAGRVAELVSFDLEYTAMVNRAVGSERWLIQAETCGGHSYSAFGNPNAIACLSSLVCQLYRQAIPQIPGTKTTYNVGTIQGGTSVNTIAQHAEMLYEYRSDDRESLEIMRKHLEAALDFYRTKGIQVKVTVVGSRPCGIEVDKTRHEALISRAQAAVEKYFGFVPVTGSASTDCNIPLSMGIPSLEVSCGRGGGAHTRGEFIEMDSQIPGMKLAFDLILHHM